MKQEKMENSGSGVKSGSLLAINDCKLLNKAAIALARSVVKVHKRLAPWRRAILVSVFGFCSECKQRPTCSEYLLEQTEKSGWRGLARGIKRMLACH